MATSSNYIKSPESFHTTIYNAPQPKIVQYKGKVWYKGVNRQLKSNPIESVFIFPIVDDLADVQTDIKLHFSVKLGAHGPLKQSLNGTSVDSSLYYYRLVKTPTELKVNVGARTRDGVNINVSKTPFTIDIDGYVDK